MNRLCTALASVILAATACGLPDDDPELLSSGTADGGRSADATLLFDSGTGGPEDVGVSTMDAGSDPTDDAGVNGSNDADGQPSVVDTGEPAEDSGTPQPVCGDGQVEGAEACDDGNARAGDGCSASCMVESGYRCPGEPSQCAPAPSSGSGDGMCESDYGADVYDPFPGNNNGYPIGDSGAYGWSGEDFESYAHQQVIESSSNKGMQSHLEVTSGVLEARHINGSQLYKRGWTTTYNFRVLSRATDAGSKVRFSDVDVRARVYLRDWQAGASATNGAHLFARYQTENDLYVVSLRNDNQVTIKRKHCDIYTTLASSTFSQGMVQTRKWYDLRFEVVGQRLRFYVDGNLELEAFDDTLSWGTTGIRTDRVDVYFDDWAHF